MAKVLARLISTYNIALGLSASTGLRLKTSLLHPALSSIVKSQSMSSAPPVIPATEKDETDAPQKELDPEESVPDGLLAEFADFKPDEPPATAPVVPKPDFVRIKKKKIVLLLSYCGQGYYGMQKNPGTKTIEGDLFEALLKNKYVDEEIVQRPQLAGFQRAARTDKNVSAARQIISIKAPDTVEISSINEHLPPFIRVMGMKRVTRGFDSKINCDARTYSYMTPTFAFAPVEEIVTEGYRITPGVLEEVRKTLALYVGAKNFHNFTSRKRFNDPSAIRFIMSFDCSDPFIKDGLEFVILRVKGQSFMMHQIRKMIGLVTAILRGFATPDVFEKAYSSSRIDIPRAPGVGLMLEEVHYHRYDERYGKDGMHEVLTWDELKSQVDQFCDEFIYPIVTKTENEEKSMLNWLGTLAYHSYDVRVHEVLETGEVKETSDSQIGKAFSKVCKGLSGDDEDEEDGGDDDEEDSSKAKRKKLRSS